MKRSSVVMLVIAACGATATGCMSTGARENPVEAGIVCREVGSAPGEMGGVLLRCQKEPEPAPPAPTKGPCTGIVAVIGGPVSVGTCVANCQACALPAQTRQKMERQLDASCNVTCQAKGSCPQNQQCVLDKVLNITESPNCIPASEYCRRSGNPNTPALCIEISLVGECTCKCQ